MTKEVEKIKCNFCESTYKVLYTYEETRLKIGQTSLGRTWSEESRKKKSESMKGNTHRKGGAPTQGFTGRKHSEETREKMRLSQQNRRKVEAP